MCPRTNNIKKLSISFNHFKKLIRKCLFMQQSNFLSNETAYNAGCSNKSFKKKRPSQNKIWDGLSFYDFLKILDFGVGINIELLS